MLKCLIENNATNNTIKMKQKSRFVQFDHFHFVTAVAHSAYLHILVAVHHNLCIILHHNLCMVLHHRASHCAKWLQNGLHRRHYSTSTGLPLMKSMFTIIGFLS